MKPINDMTITWLSENMISARWSNPIKTRHDKRQLTSCVTVDPPGYLAAFNHNKEEVSVWNYVFRTIYIHTYVCVCISLSLSIYIYIYTETEMTYIYIYIYNWHRTWALSYTNCMPGYCDAESQTLWATSHHHWNTTITFNVERGKFSHQPEEGRFSQTKKIIYIYIYIYTPFVCLSLSLSTHIYIYMNVYIYIYMYIHQEVKTIWMFGLGYNYVVWADFQFDFSGPYHESGARKSACTIVSRVSA